MLTKSKKIFSVTVGIPAYNEEANIGNLLRQLLEQKEKALVLEKIIVSSDGSCDKTVDIAKSFKDRRISVLDNKERRGVAFCQNQIMKLCNSDVLVLLNADISIKEKDFLNKFVCKLVKSGADLISCRIVPLPPKNIFEEALYVSVLVKKDVSENFDGGRNLFTCHGVARAFSKNIYKNFNFPQIVSEDAYSYLWCVSNGYKYDYAKEASVNYKLPDNLKDHEKQSLRFYKGQKKLQEIFGAGYVKKAHSLPKNLIFKKSIKHLLKYPLASIFYIAILFYMKAKSYFGPEVKIRWEISESTRSLN